MSIEDTPEAVAAIDPDFAEAVMVMSDTFDAFTLAARQQGITVELTRMIGAQLRVAADAFDRFAVTLEGLEAQR